MTWVLAGILGVHGLIHLMGFAKAFGYAELPQLTQPISRPWGVAWLTAALMVTASAITFGIGARRFWIIGAIAVMVSQVVIVSAWRDAWAGTIANAILLALVIHAWRTEGPSSFRAQFERDAEAGLARPVATATISEADLATLPEPAQRYLRLVGVVGQPRVQNYRLLVWEDPGPVVTEAGHDRHADGDGLEGHPAARRTSAIAGTRHVADRTRAPSWLCSGEPASVEPERSNGSVKRCLTAAR